MVQMKKNLKGTNFHWKGDILLEDEHEFYIEISISRYDLLKYFGNNLLIWYGRNMIWRTILWLPNLLFDIFKPYLKLPKHTDIECEEWNKIP